MGGITDYSCPLTVGVCHQVDMEVDYTDLALETVETWTVAAMKSYLRKRGLQLTGVKKILAARVYVAGN